MRVEVESNTGVFKPLEELPPRSTNGLFSKIGLTAGALVGGAAVMAYLKRSRV